MGVQENAVTRTATARLSRRAFSGGVGAGLAAIATGGRVGGQTPEAAEAVAPIVTSPAHGTRTAMPATEISFRGVTAAALGRVTVIGSVSGAHSGVVLPHGGDRGASFVPDSPFQAGERVTVRAGVPLRPTRNGSITFDIGIPAPPVATPVWREADQPQDPPRSFRSRLDLLPPAIEVTTAANGTAPGLVCVGAKIEDGQNGALILDNTGEPVWFAPTDDPVAVHNDVRVQQYEGQPVLTMWEGIAKQGTGFGHVVLLDRAYERIATIQAGNGYPGIDQHECRLTPEGTVLLIVYNPLQWDLSRVGGEENGVVLDGVVQEIEIATGRVIYEWHCLDHIALGESYGLPAAEPVEPWDYVHINSVEATDDGDLIISGRHTHAIYCVERQGGRVRWRLNGKASDFTMGEGAAFAYQHDARLHANGELSLFDNAEANQDKAGEVHSRGLVLALDEQQRTATVVREYVHPTEILSVSQGNMQMLPNGNVFIGWGSAPVFTELDVEGEVRFNGRLPGKGTSYRAYRCEWVGQPAAPPDVAAEAGLGDEVTVYASWNGATEVVRWQVLAGERLDALAGVGGGPRTGFETTLTARAAGPWIAIEALDRNGEVLGTSPPVEVVR